MLYEKCNELSKEISYSIIGAYLVGAGENVASIDKNTPLKTLGESFCLYDENNPIDLTKSNLVDLNNFGSAPEAGAVTSSLINQCNNKMKERTKFLAAQDIPIAEAFKELTKYAKKVESAAVTIALGEGALDDDLKEDFKTLIKEAKNEFIKREEEEQTQEEAIQDTTEVPMEDPSMGDDPVIDDGLAEFDENFEEEGFDDIMNTSDEQLEEGEEVSNEEAAEEDFDIPEGTEGEAYNGYDVGDRVAYGEGFMDDFIRGAELKSKRSKDVRDLLIDFDELKELEYKIDDRYTKAEEKRNEEFNATKGIKKWFDSVQASDFGHMENGEFVLDKPVDDIIKAVLLAGDQGHINDGKFVYVGTAVPVAAGLVIPGLFASRLPRWIASVSRLGVIKIIGIAFVAGMIAKEYSIRVNADVNLMASLACIQTLTAIKPVYADLLKQAMAKSDGKYIKKFTSALETIDGKLEVFKYDVEKYRKIIAKREAKRNKRKEVVNNVPGHENFNVMDDNQFNELLNKRNSLYAHAEHKKFLYKGEVTNISPFDLKRMKNELLEIEAMSIKMLGENFQLNNVIEDPVLKLKHKNTVNELALVIAARNKFGFR